MPKRTSADYLNGSARLKDVSETERTKGRTNGNIEKKSGAEK
jgi:hypothetical protein